MSSEGAPRQAVILAGGHGTRLQPYSTVLPKPLMPIGEHPILEIVVQQLAHYGFRDIVLAVGYLAELIMAYFGDGARWGVRLQYSREENPLGTAGPLTLVRKHLSYPFLLMNGDLLTDLNFRNLLDFHLTRGGAATVALARRSVQVDFGVVHIDDKQRLTGWDEKPEITYLVSTGIYIFHPNALNHIPMGEPFDLPQLVLHLVENGEQVNTYFHEGYWLDIGRPEDYQRANQDFQSNSNLWISSGSTKSDQ